jgi:hypothetical protein
LDLRPWCLISSSCIVRSQSTGCVDWSVSASRLGFANWECDFATTLTTPAYSNRLYSKKLSPRFA